MKKNSVALAEVSLFQMHLKRRAAICYAMVAGGVITLFSGVAMLSVGISGDQMVWFESHSIKVTAGGFGAITMLASVLWGLFCLPIKARDQIFWPDQKFVIDARGSRARRTIKKDGEQEKAGRRMSVPWAQVCP